MMELYELRCRLRFDAGRTAGGALVLDADLLHAVDGKINRSEVLAVGETAWPAPTARYGQAELDAWASIRNGVAASDEAPALLPEAAVKRSWGLRIAQILESAIGTAPLDVLFIERAAGAKTLVRVVFWAQDNVSANLPIETLVWRERLDVEHPETTPLVAETERHVSILRVADKVQLATRLRLGGHRPGAHVARIAYPEKQGTEFVEQIEAATVALGSVNPASFTDERGLAELIDQADLAVIVGHGSGPEGIRMSAGSLDAQRLANAVAGSRVVVLAMCGSAQSQDLKPDPTRAVARQGTPLTVGFQGQRVSEDHVSRFLDAATGQLRNALSQEVADARVRLADWEEAIAAGRRASGDGAVVPVIYAHPALLLGASAPTTPRRSRAVPQSSVKRSPVASKQSQSSKETAWCVPGQLILALDARNDRPVRVPLPVDVGLRVEVEPTRNGRSPSLAGAHGMSKDDLYEMLGRWGIASDMSFDVTVTDDLVPAPARRQILTWALRSAEISAVIRAVQKAFSRDVPPAVSALLDQAVHDDGGAHGPDLNFVSADDGQLIRGIKAHAWLVTTLSDAPTNGLTGVFILDACLSRSPEQLSELADGLDDPTWLRKRIDDQNGKLLQSRTPPPRSMRQVLGRREPIVVFPSAARLDPAPGATTSRLSDLRAPAD